MFVRRGGIERLFTHRAGALPDQFAATRGAAASVKNPRLARTDKHR